ncbi:glycosyltransferase family 2 protein [Yeosuana sp. MJ-SS3]|uniref:Glycosyltransferase family 2 protein n=1 Tax=Gilvirhabdus luticola TaxID=3079858 RepID=A0ABU3U4Z1_9FLAO|nr:glycosyltransferase family 2 protein [Yeosuana sp. MJ-SS3]MDU8885478.1 glycosyltransferase family 2 protein [Yeosuana sp. MJ-SS3]
MTPLVSVIIPVFNREKLILETLESISAQSYEHWECLVIDDRSTDLTVNEIKKYLTKDNRVKVFIRPSNKPKGANACRNYGLELSNGTYINWFDSDDIMHPDKIRLQIEALESSNNPFCVCQSYIFKNDIKNVIGFQTDFITSKSPFDDFLTKKIVWLTQSPIFRKDFLIENDYLFDEDLQAGQDWEMFSRILFNNSNYIPIEKPLVYLRQHKNNTSRGKNEEQLWYYFLARYKIYVKFKDSLSFENIEYLKCYFLNSFKLLLRYKQYNKSYNVWKMALITDKTYTIKQHFYFILSMLSFVMFRKGDKFINKLERK